MNWKKEAEKDLRDYAARKSSLTRMAERIEGLESDFTTVKGAIRDETPVRGGGSRIEDRMLNNIVMRERLKATMQATKRLVDMTEDGLHSLTQVELKVLDEFYIHPSKGAPGRLTRMLGYEQAQIYRIRGDAIYKFTIGMYGLMDY